MGSTFHNCILAWERWSTHSALELIGPGLSLQMLDHHLDTKWRPWWPGRPCYHPDILAPKPAGGHVTHLDAELETSWRLDHHLDNSLCGGVVLCVMKLVRSWCMRPWGLEFELPAVQIYCHYISKLKVKSNFFLKMSTNQLYLFIYVT